MQRSVLQPRPASAGFTLIELMITVAIVGILAAVAYPSFVEAVRKSRRTDAVSAIVRVQQAQERWRASHGTYTATLGAGGLNVESTSPDGHYSLAIADNDATKYTVVATAKATSPQSHDVKCKALQVRMVDGGGTTSGLIEYGSTDDGGALTVSTGNPCWVK